MSVKQPKRTPRPGLDAYGRTPLILAVIDGDQTRVAELLEAGADPNVQDDNGWSALHFAAQGVSAPMTELLLASGARVTLKDSFGNTALSRAVFCSRDEGAVIALLLGAGADPHEPNSRGISPLKLAHNIGNYDTKRFFKDLPPPPIEP